MPPSLNPSPRPTRCYLILLSLAFLLFFPGLGRKELWSSHEPRAGQPTYQKPPLYYRLAAASMKLFGVNAFAVRLPAATTPAAVARSLAPRFMLITLCRCLDDIPENWIPESGPPLIQNDDDKDMDVFPFPVSVGIDT